MARIPLGSWLGRSPQGQQAHSDKAYAASPPKAAMRMQEIRMANSFIKCALPTSNIRILLTVGVYQRGSGVSRLGKAQNTWSRGQFLGAINSCPHFVDYVKRLTTKTQRHQGQGFHKKGYGVCRRRLRRLLQTPPSLLVSLTVRDMPLLSLLVIALGAKECMVNVWITLWLGDLVVSFQ